MGQAKIISGGENGLYNIEIIKYAGSSTTRLASIAARLSALAVSMTTASNNVTAKLNALSAAQSALNILIAVYDGSTEQRAAIKTATSSMITAQSEVTKAQMQLSKLTAEKSALLSEQSLINSAMTTDVRSHIWCADFTEDLAPGVIVGTIEINGVDNQIVIMPGGNETGALGLIQHSGVSTGAAVFYNKTLLPCWQKWKPTYRIGKIIAINFEDDTCDVGIAAQYSNEQGLPINQDGEAWNSVESLVAGWDAFAAENPEFPLVSNTGDTTIPMTDILKAAMDNVQSEINDRNKYITDTKQYGKLENWAIMEEGGSGDCEDFALTKAKKLLDMGYPASALHIEVGTIPGGEGHAWLVVQTDQGDYALDNIFKPIMKNTILPYSGRKRQTGSNWINKGVKLSDVTIEYMDGVNSDAFEIDDRVVVAFTDQDWNKPKVIGFESNPKPGYAMLSFINNAYVDPRKIRKYKISGEFIADIPTTISNNAQVTMASDKFGAAVYVVFNDLFGTHMTLTIDRYTPAGKTSIVYDLWQGYISTYFAAITKDYCSVHDMGEAFFDDYGLIYIPLAIYGGSAPTYMLVGFIVVNPADGSLAGEYWHNYGGSIYFYPNAPAGGFVANNNVYLADISDGSTGYPIIRILDNNNYVLLNTISLSGKIYKYANAVHATTEKIYAVYPSSSGTILKIFNQATNVLLSTYTLSISEALWPPNIFVVGSSLYIVLTISASTTVFVFDLSGNLKSTIDIGYTEYESSFTLASANII